MPYREAILARCENMKEIESLIKYKFYDSFMMLPPTFSGIYIFYLLDYISFRMIYIGQSKNIKKRISMTKHIIKRFEYSNNDILACRFIEIHSKEKRLKYEKMLIRKYRPYLNSNHINN